MDPGHHGNRTLFRSSNVNAAKIIFSSAALIAGAFAIGFGVAGSVAAMGWTAGLAAAFLFVANIDRIAEFSLGPGGFRTTTRQLNEVRVALSDLQQLSAVMVRAILATAESAGRAGGVPEHKKDELTEGLVAVLKRIQLPKDLLDQIFTDVRDFIVFDYAHYILGGVIIPNRQDPQVQADWREVRGKGLMKIATPDEIEAFLKKYGMLHEERRELLEDYRYFLKHQTHRRPDVWARREEWGRLR